MINTMNPPVLRSAIRRNRHRLHERHTDWRDRRKAQAAFHRMSDRLRRNIDLPQWDSVGRDPSLGPPQFRRLVTQLATYRNRAQIRPAAFYAGFTRSDRGFSHPGSNHHDTPTPSHPDGKDMT